MRLVYVHGQPPETPLPNPPVIRLRPKPKPPPKRRKPRPKPPFEIRRGRFVWYTSSPCSGTAPGCGSSARQCGAARASGADRCHRTDTTPAAGCGSATSRARGPSRTTGAVSSHSRNPSCGCRAASTAACRCCRCRPGRSRRSLSGKSFPSRIAVSSFIIM